MSDYFIEMINDIDFSYGFIYECADLVNYLYDDNIYDHLAIKLYSNFVLPIINITKDEHIKEYNERVKNSKYRNRNCSYLMDICDQRYLKLSKDEYSKIKKFIDDNIDAFESMLASIHDSIDLYKKCCNSYCYCPCSCHCLKRYNECVCDNSKYKEFCEENNFILKGIVKSYFNVEYIKFFYLLQKVFKLSTSNIHSDILVNMFINLYDNSNIDCNEKVKSKICDLYQNLRSGELLSEIIIKYNER